jgi:predicted permease
VQATEPLADLARRVLDGAPIDWAAAESSASHDERAVVRQLRVIEGLAVVHRREPAVVRTQSWTPTVFSNLARADVPEWWGHLKILERIGRGAFGVVYRALDSRLDREVALKLLPAPRDLDARASLTIIEEGRLLARVRHANVVTIHGADRIGDHIGLWMELVRGQTLEQLLQRGTTFSAADTIAIGLELCRAVSAVHAAGLLHRDIKAHNVTRADDGRVVLMDFGAGRELDDSSSSDLTGTPLYLAPEVFRGETATVQSDLYCLGVLLYHLLTGKYPVKGQTIRDVRAAHERSERTSLKAARPDLPPALARTIDRAIDPDPAARYQTARALAADLKALGGRSRAWPFDLRNGLRQVRRTPVLTFVIAGVLAIGIGANTALLTLLDALLLRAPAGVEDGRGLVRVSSLIRISASRDPVSGGMSYPDFLAFRERRDVFAGLAAERTQRVAVGGDRGTTPRPASLVSSEYFSVLRPRLALGSVFVPEDDERPPPRAQAVLSHSFWTRELGGREDVVGRAIDVNGVPVTVIGVTADPFVGVGVPDDDKIPVMWLPVSLQSTLFPESGGVLASRESTGFNVYGVYGRLASEMTLDGATAAAATIAARPEPISPPGDSPYRRVGVRVSRLRAVESAGDVLATVGLAGGLLSGLLLLLTCANASNLLLAHAVVRRQEIGVKLALGASRGRLVRQLLTEALWIALLAAAIGFVLLAWLLAVFEGVLTFAIDLSPRPHVLLVTAGIAVLTGVAFGVVPALHGTQASVSDMLKTGGAGIDPRTSRLLRGFVVAQVTLSLPLLMTAALMGATIHSWNRADLGFTASEDVLGVKFDFGLAGYTVERADASIEALRERVATLPGVRAVAVASYSPLFGGTLRRVELPPGEATRHDVSRLQVVEADPAYFTALGIPIVRGRGLDDGDVVGAPLVAVVGEDFARAVWPGDDPLGRTVHTILDTTRTPVAVTVVGVAGAVRSSPDGSNDDRYAYVARRQIPHRSAGLLILRTSGDAAGLIPALRMSILQLDSRLPIAALQTFEQARRAGLTEYLGVLAIARAAAWLALGLACLGVYSIAAFSVAQRGREVAIRMALGARASTVITLFVRQGAQLSLYGIVLGVPFGLAVRFALSNALGAVGFSTGTVLTLAGVALTLLLTATAASLLPALRAARVQPIHLLRAE